MRDKSPIWVTSLLILSLFLLSSCETTMPKHLMGIVKLPHMYASADECYYLDEFLPTPDHLVSGRSNGLHLRYYTYRKALYKIWTDKDIQLSFFSNDSECWSLFSEQIVLYNY